MRYEKIAEHIREATPDKRLLKINLTQKDIEGLKSASQIALAVIGTVGVATVAMVAPNLLLLLDKFTKYSKNKSRWNHQDKQQKVVEVFYYLKKTGQINLHSVGKNVEIKITQKGQKNLDKINFQALSVPKGKKWDGKWWLVAADIPTKEHRLSADYFRKKVRQMGLYPLQKSLWVYPYQPVKQIEFTANYYNIGRFVTVMEISRMDVDDERKLREFFKI